MKRGSTMFLKAVIVCIGLVALAVCTVALPMAIAAEPADDFDYGMIFIGLYAPAIPFFMALHQALNLLRFIDANKAFSLASVKALQRIKHCALVISVLFTLGMPYIFYVAERDDAPGVVLIGCIIIGASFVIATAAGVFQQLFQSAVDIKSENDLTV